MTRTLLSALAALACAETPPAEWPACSYGDACQRLNASLTVAPELCDDATAAAVEWCAATDGLACVTVVCGSVPAPRPYAIALAPNADKAPRVADTWPDGRIVVYAPRASATVLAHELGHFFGLTHDPESGSIMCADLGCASERVTGRDARRLREALAKTESGT